jgi:ribosome biogenesis protein ENP2
MAIKIETFNDCKVYNLSSGKTMPQWLSDSKKRSLLKDEEYRKRLELIQDFEMTVASQCIKMTNDGEYIIVTGTYPPIVRCYTVSDLSMKFQRGLTCEVIAFETLSDDFGKLVFLQSDRTLNFHAPYGTHYSVRVPKFGRDLAYNVHNCDLYVCGSGDEIYRLNLEQGQFKEPFRLGFEGCNKIYINPMHQLIGCGGVNATCEFWDPRARKLVAKMCVDSSRSVEITALKFDNDGLTLGVGTSDGNCKLYDIRSAKPLYIKEHQYGLPVIDVTFHNSSRHVLSTDKKIMKIWDREESRRGTILTNIEATANINAVHLVSDKKGPSGLIFMAGEQTRVMSYFVPNLGHAPRWCSFLESLTEELEESANQNVYEDYKFITQKEVEDLGATALIGTPLLRGYMHGYFIEMKLYNRLRAVSKPFEYEEYRIQKIREKIEEKRQSRITARKRLPKVNQRLAERMLAKKATKESSEITDDRFSALFKREEFQQDEESAEFKLRKPTVGGKSRKNKQDDSDDEDGEYNIHADRSTSFNKKDDDNDDGDDKYMSDGDGEHNSVLDSDESISDNVNYKSFKKPKGSKTSKGENIEKDEEGQFLKATKRKLSLKESAYNKKGATRKAPVMFDIPSGISSSKAIFSSDNELLNSSGNNREDITLSQRLESQMKYKSQTSNGSLHTKNFKDSKNGLMREISFIPKKSGNRKDNNNNKVKKESRIDQERAHFIK